MKAYRCQALPADHVMMHGQREQFFFLFFFLISFRVGLDPADDFGALLLHARVLRDTKEYVGKGETKKGPLVFLCVIKRVRRRRTVYAGIFCAWLSAGKR